MTGEQARLESAVDAVRTFCETRTPEDLRDEIRLDVSRRGRSITIHESRPPWDPERIGPEWTSTSVAQLRYDGSAGSWSLYCSDSGGRWWKYDGIGPAATVGPLLREIDRDPTGIFWG